MMPTLKKIIAASIAASAITVAAQASAALTTFDIKWKNPNGADVAFAALTIDTALIDSSNNGTLIGIDQIHSLDMTVRGANVGNGHFSKSDFTNVLFYTASPVNFQKQLIGQMVDVSRGSISYQIGYGDADGASGGFGFYAGDVTTPTTVRPFAMVTDRSGQFSDYMVVSSIIARDAVSAVPEAETYAMLIGGLGLLALRARRQRRG